MTTLWKYRIMLFIREVDKTPENKRAFAQVFVDGESGESLEDEKKLFDNVVRLSVSGDEPAQAFGISTYAKPFMKDGLKVLLDNLTNSRYIISAAVDLPNYIAGELITTNFPVIPNGQQVSWATALQYIESQFGLIVVGSLDDLEEIP